MFASLLRVTLRGAAEEKLAPKEWLDQFFMRDFTGHRAFDETLVVGDGLLEAGFLVSPDSVRQHFEKWLRGRKMLPPETGVSVEPLD